MSKFLSRDEILGVEDLQSEVVEVPEWGGAVMVRSMTGKERSQYEAGMYDQSGKGRVLKLENLYAKLVALTVVDEDGKRIFSMKDAELLGEKSAGALSRVAQVSMRLSGLEASDLEEIAKNSESSQSSDSGMS
jgi:hypothetical protein